MHEAACNILQLDVVSYLSLVTILASDVDYCSFQRQTPPLGWRVSRSSSTDELVYVNEYNEEEVSMLLTDFQDNEKNYLILGKINFFLH